jgi:hypothetical protein
LLEETAIMTEEVQLAALAVIELTARQIMDPGRTQLHRDELAVILRDVHPVMVALEVATILAGVVTASWLPLGQLIQAKRARLPAYLTGTDATATDGADDGNRPALAGRHANQTIDRCRGHRDAAVDSDIAVAHGTFLDELTAGRLRHAGQPELTSAIRHGQQRRLGGAMAWERRGAVVDVSPALAAEIALWALLELERHMPAIY